MLERFRFAEKVVHERTRLDMERVTEDVRAVLETIDENLFNPGFRFSSVKISKATRAAFQEQLNATPQLYIRVRRIEVALFLLDYTEARVPEIAKLVAYPKVFSFNHTFKKMMGASPIAERRRWRSGQGKGVLALVAGHSRGRRLFQAAVDRLCLVGALPPRNAAFHLATLAHVVSNQREVERIENLLSAYLAGYEGAVDARPEVPALDLTEDTIRPADYAEILEAAAEPTREALSRLADEVPEELRPMFLQLRTDFTTPGYTLDEMREVLRASTVDLARFTRAMGISPWQYVIEARMETAARLLRDTSLSIPMIASLFGYSEPGPFRYVFLKWSGQLTPHEYRARVREVVARVGPMPEELVHWRFLERVWSRDADEGEGSALLRYMERVYGFEPCELSPEPEALASSS